MVGRCELIFITVLFCHIFMLNASVKYCVRYLIELFTFRIIMTFFCWEPCKGTLRVLFIIILIHCQMGVGVLTPCIRSVKQKILFNSQFLVFQLYGICFLMLNQFRNKLIIDELTISWLLYLTEI